MKKVGFIGLGNMGTEMVKNLLDAGFEVIGYDKNEKLIKNLIPFGLKKTTKLEDIPPEVDIIITMLPDGKVVEEVYDSIFNTMRPNTLFTDCSTIDVKKAKLLHQKCREKNFLSLDAPVSGGVGGAKNGTLTFMVGGNNIAYKMMLPLFKVMGKKSLLCGESGSGQATKACNNMLLAISMIGVGEALNLGDNLGLDKNKLFEILSTSTGSCWSINSYFPLKGVGPKSPADDNFEPGFSANLMLKDLTIAVQSINETKTPAPFGKKAQENFEKMVNENKGNLDFSAITIFNK